MGSLTLMGAGPSGAGGVAYQAAVLADSPLLYWRHGDTSGTTAADSSGNGRTGTYVSTVTLNQPGAISDGNPAVYMDPAGTPAVTSTFAGWASGRTWEVWLNKPNTNLNFDRYIACGEGANNPAFFFLGGFSGASIRYDPDLSAAGGNGDWTGLSIVGNGWHQVVLTHSGTTAELWIDAVSQGTKVVSTFGAAPGNFSLGRQKGGGFEFIDGYFDETAIYGSVLSSARIQAHFNAR